MCTSECKRGRKVCLRDTLSHSSPNQAREKTTKHNCSHSPSRSVARVTRFVILASIKYSKGLSGHGAQSRDWRPKSRCAGGGGRGGGAPCAVPPRCPTALGTAGHLGGPKRARGTRRAGTAHLGQACAAAAGAEQRGSG